MTTTNLSDERLLSRAEVEGHFGLSRRFLELAAVKGGGPPMIRIGRRRFYRVADLRGWIESRRVMSTSEGEVSAVKGE